MNRSRAPIFLTAAATAWVYACGDGNGGGGTAPEPPDPPVASAVTVTPANSQLGALGATVRLSAQVRDQNGQVMAGASVTWASDDLAVASVDAGGVATAVGNGSATITATAGSASGSATVSVAQMVSAVTVRPSDASLVAGDSAQLAAEAADANGNAVENALFEWASSDPEVARVNAEGLVVAVGAGAAEVTATSAGVAGRAAIMVEAAMATTVMVSPDSLLLTAIGETARLSAEVRDQTGRVMGGVGVTWSSGDAAVAVVDAEGVVTANGNGIATITATAGTLSGSATVTVARMVSAVTVSPNEVTLGLGDETVFAAEAADANGHMILGALFEWASTDTLVARVDSARNNLALVRAVDLGTAEVTATSAGVTGRAMLTVVRAQLPPASVKVIPDSVVLTAIGDTARISAEVLDREGRLLPDAAVSWRAVIPAVAVIDSTGLVTARGSGTTPVEATAGDVFGVGWVHVRPGADSVAVDQASAEIEPGGTVQLRAWAYDDAGQILPGAVFQWSTSNAAVATVNESGLVRGVSEGNATITAQSGNARATSEITVARNRDRETLTAFYNATGGSGWTNRNNWLTDAPLGNWHGVSVDARGKVVELDLFRNNLSGRLPPEIGNLSRLERLDLQSNNITGPIPAQLGNLAQLQQLALQSNKLTGSIPAQLGKLTRLTQLWVHQNNLTGSIPAEMGNLGNLTTLYLSGNGLTGPIPPELGKLSSLQWLFLQDNNLSGSVPAEFGRLSRLRELHLTNNTGLTGSLPSSLTALRELTKLLAGGTGLCAPADPAFQAWLATISERRIPSCAAGAASQAYLTQAVQSRSFPVDLVAGEQALLRVFPTATRTTSAGIPAVRARFYRNGGETHVANIPGKSTPIPTEVMEGDLARSANAVIPANVIQPGLEMVIEVDPDGTLDASLGVVKRIPATGRLAVQVRTVPTMDLTLIPFILREGGDSSIIDLVGAMAANPASHELLDFVHVLLPLKDVRVTAHEPVLTTTIDVRVLFNETKAIRVAEGGKGHYMGMMKRSTAGGGFGGASTVGGHASFALPDPRIIAHEIGHMLSLQHAPCGTTAGVDQSYPHADGAIGAWGYDFQDGGSLFAPSTKDLMSYCGTSAWISDYHFSKALSFWRATGGAGAARSMAASGGSLLLWGGVGPDGAPFLEPAFATDAPPELPRSGGDYRLVGRTATGDELFDLSFDMPDVAHGGGGFAFAVPARAGWMENLADITLTGPGGSATLDGATDRTAVMVRNPRTGQIRGILRDLPEAALDQADVAAAGSGFELLVSRGIPDPETWRREN